MLEPSHLANNDPGGQRPPAKTRCPRCNKEDTLELGSVSSRRVWFACNQCNFVWSVREKESDQDDRRESTNGSADASRRQPRS